MTSDLDSTAHASLASPGSDGAETLASGSGVGVSRRPETPACATDDGVTGHSRPGSFGECHSLLTLEDSGDDASPPTETDWAKSESTIGPIGTAHEDSENDQ
jgi:hypothetical protein